MFNILISLGSGLFVTLVTGYALGYPRLSIGYGIFPGLIVAIGLFIYMSRRIGKEIEVLMTRVQELMQPKNPMKPDRNRFGRAIEALKEGYRFNRWQIMGKEQIDGQIGVLHFLDMKFEDAQPYLENTINRNWIAKGMLGVIHYKRKNYTAMRQVFEKAVKSQKKESLLWNVYAFCVWKSGNRADAIDILSRGGEILSDDPRIASNKLALQNKKKMKMRGWKEMWYQFHLDTPPQPKMQVDKRQIYRGR